MSKLKLILVISVIFVSCTDNQMARNYGGVEKIQLPEGERIVTVTWKEDNLWYLTKKDTTKPTTYVLKEKSSYGMFQGTVEFIEH